MKKKAKAGRKTKQVAIVNDGIESVVGPRDGYRVTQFHSRITGQYSVYVDWRWGRRNQGFQVWESKKGDPDGLAHAEQTRQINFWTAVARYLNSGGKLRNLRDVVNHAMRTLGPDAGVDWEGQGAALFQTVQEEATKHFIVCPDKEHYLVWLDGISVEMRPLPELLEELARARHAEEAEDL